MMTKLLKFILGGCLILSLSIFGFTPDTNESKEALQKAAASVGYSREEIKTALLEYEKTGRADAMIQEILLPASMGIEIPSLNPAKVLNETPLKEYGGREEFYAALRAHGYDDPDMENMPYWQYEQLEANWLLEPKMVELLAATNPELADRDLSQWTYADYNRFNEQRNQENLINWFTEEQQAELKARGIKNDDLRPLLKMFHQPDNILAQPDYALKAILEDWYETKLTLSLGADWRESARLN